MIKEAKTYFILIMGLIAISLIIWVSIAVFNGDDQADTSDSYVTVEDEYTSSSDLTSRCPDINLDGEDVDRINKMFKIQYDEVISKDNENFDFDYTVNNDYLSLVTFYIYIDKDTSYPKLLINTYNFDLEDNSLVSDKELLENFSYTYDDISNSFERTIKKYYQQELESMYFTEEECDYNCFLNLREISNYRDNIKLFVKDNELVFYRSFNVYSEFLEDQFYRNEDFLFEIE